MLLTTEDKQRMEKALRVNCEAVKKLLSQLIPKDDIDSVQDKIMDLTEITGLTAESMAIAKNLHLHAQGIALENGVASGYTGNALKMYIESECRTEIMWVTFTDRLQSGTTHSLDGLRTIVSLYKEELSNSMKA